MLRFNFYSNEEILAGNGYGIEDSQKGVEIIHSVRTQTPIGLKRDYHPFAKIKQHIHPFISHE